MTGEATGPLGRARALLRAGSHRGGSAPTPVVVDASLTDVWRRRVLAAVIDLGLVAGVLATLTLLQVQRLTRDSAGLLSPTDIDRWNTLAAIPNRQVVLGNTTYVLAGAELIMTVLITVTLALAVFVLIPAYTGTSPGKRAFGLRVATIDGGMVGLRHTVLRGAAGIVDVLPGIVPWALGARLAQGSPWHQRLGDRVAGTVVIDARRMLTVGAAGTSAVEGPTADPGATATSETPPPLPTVVRPAEPEIPVRVEPLVAPTSTVSAGTAPPPERRAPVAAGPSRPNHPALATSGRTSVAGELFAVPRSGAGTAPATRRTPPPPQHRRSAAAGAPTPQPVSADPSREVPRAEPAPARERPSTADTATRAWLGDLAAALAPTSSGTVGTAAAPSPVADEAGDDPVWNDEWQAWLYFDRGRGRWQRHDAATDGWVAIG